ncbi:hypothetical protein ACH8KY_002874 [Salmonella enterica subsp. enterica serovar Braenderup]|nr:hypothetical protein [Salmonella enterica]
MTVYLKSPPPAPQLPEIDPSQIAGRFGAMPAGEYETIADLNLAPVGLCQARKAEPGRPVTTVNTPPGAEFYGAVYTLSSAGAGKDGRRHLTSPLEEDEVVVQFYYDTSARLYTRSGFGRAGFTPWKKRWG